MRDTKNSAQLRLSADTDAGAGPDNTTGEGSFEPFSHWFWLTPKCHKFS